MAKVIVDGQTLEATFSITKGETDRSFVLTINSGSGSKGGQPGINADYKRGFEIILSRLGAAHAIIEGAWLAPKIGAKTRTLLEVEGRPYPWRLTPTDDCRRLRLDIGKAQERTNRQPGAKGSGNRTKRVEIQLDLPLPRTVSQAEQWISSESSTADVSVADLRPVDTPEEIAEAIRQFEEAGPDLLLSLVENLVRTERHWVYDSATGGFGPSTFVGFGGMTIRFLRLES